MTNKDKRNLRKILAPTEVRQVEVCFEAYDNNHFGQRKIPDYDQLEQFLTECLNTVKKLNTPVDEAIAA